jgi:glutaconate CoA-transferase subunit B
MSADRSAVADLMAAVLARLVVPGDVIGVGLGTPLALAAALLARHRHGGAVHVLAGGALDVDGDLDVWMGGPVATKGRTPGYVPHFDSMDMAERQAMTLQFLRPAQVDAAGNLNTSRIGPRSAPAVRFPGGLATADVPALLPRVIAYHPDHRPRSLPDRVDWVTGAGAGWSGASYFAAGTVALVTDLAVIEFAGGAARVVSIHSWSDADEVAEKSGFDLAADVGAEMTPEPDEDELAALEALDPNRRRDREIPNRTGKQTGVRA